MTGLEPVDCCNSTNASNVIVNSHSSAKHHYRLESRSTAAEEPISFYRRCADTVQESPKSPKQYSLPHLAHYVKVVLQIMNRGERGEQHFAGLEEVTQVSPRVSTAGNAV